MRAHVYVMISEQLGLMKVGWSGSVRARNSQLRMGQNSLRRPIDDLRVLYLIDTQIPLEIERYMHGFLGRKPGAGEWFPLDLPAIEACLEEVAEYYSEACPDLRIYSPLPQPWPMADFKWGGARPGAGRKATESGCAVQVTLQVPQEVKKWLEDVARTESISLSKAAARELIAEWREATVGG